MSQLKVGDFVQLQAGQAPKMQISSIDETNKTALCYWYDSQKQKHNNDILPLNVLKVFPERKPIDISGLLQR